MEQLMPVAIKESPEIESPDLAEVLSAWHVATQRLERTHETLREEVCRLTDELEIKNRQLARQNRLADLGQIASHVAHEVRNNLVPVTLYLSLLRRRLSDDQGSLDVLSNVERGFSALEVTVNDLLSFTADRIPQPSRFSLRELTDDILDSFALQFGAQHIVVEVSVDASSQMIADRDLVRSAMINLVMNSLDVMPEGGSLAITSWAGPRVVEIEVADSGPGLPQDSLGKAFEPFFTTKSGGTGLGLSIVERIVSSHGGKATVQNCPEGGAAFTLSFPQIASQRAAA